MSENVQIALMVISGIIPIAGALFGSFMVVKIFDWNEKRNRKK